MKTFLKLLAVGAMLLCTAVAEGALRLEWDANPPEDQVIAYYVHASNVLTGEVRARSAGTNTFLALDETFLTLGNTYVFWLIAHNAVSQSLPSDTLKFHYDFPAMVEFASLKAKPDGNVMVIDVVWKAPDPKYEVERFYYRVVQNGVTNAAVSTGGLSTRLVVPNISPTFVHLWSENYLGASSLAMGRISIPAKPGKPIRK